MLNRIVSKFRATLYPSANLKIHRYFIDGSKIASLDDFLRAIGTAVNGKNGYFGRDLDSFDDCLFGGSGMQYPCEIVWENSHLSRRNLDRECFLSWCEESLEHGLYRDNDGKQWLEDARVYATHGLGPTMFESLVELIASVVERSQGKTVVLLSLKD